MYPSYSPIVPVPGIPPGRLGAAPSAPMPPSLPPNAPALPFGGAPSYAGNNSLWSLLASAAFHMGSGMGSGGTYPPAMGGGYPSAMGASNNVGSLYPYLNPGTYGGSNANSLAAQAAANLTRYPAWGPSPDPSTYGGFNGSSPLTPPPQNVGSSIADLFPAAAPGESPVIPVSGGPLGWWPVGGPEPGGRGAGWGEHQPPRNG